MNKIAYVVIVVIAVAVVGLFSSGIFNEKTSEITDAAAFVSGSGVYRILPLDIGAGSEMDVLLNVSVGSHEYYIIDEQIPQGWNVIDNGGGSFADSHLKWVVFSAPENRLIKYRISAPDKTGLYTFSGKFVFDSDEEKYIIGNSEIDVK